MQSFRLLKVLKFHILYNSSKNQKILGISWTKTKQDLYSFKALLEDIIEDL